MVFSLNFYYCGCLPLLNEVWTKGEIRILSPVGTDVQTSYYRACYDVTCSTPHALHTLSATCSFSSFWCAIATQRWTSWYLISQQELVYNRYIRLGDHFGFFFSNVQNDFHLRVTIFQHLYIVDAVCISNTYAHGNRSTWGKYCRYQK